MNRLHVGTDHSTFLTDIPVPYLLIYDGTYEIDLPPKRKVVHLDLRKHSLNPLQNLTYESAVQFTEILRAAFPGGEHTLTKETASIQLLEALLDRPDSLDTLVPETKEYAYANLMIRRLLLSPVLNRFLTKKTLIDLNATIICVLDGLVPFDAFVIANILIANYKGQIVLSDFHRYGHKGHLSLIGQERLIVQTNNLTTSFREDLLRIDHKIASRCTAADAAVLAEYAGLQPNTNAFTDFVQRSIR